MKKVLYILVLLVTSFTMTSCEGFTFGTGTTKPSKNYYCIDSTYTDIKSCVSYATNEELTLTFTCDDLSAILLTFDNIVEIPVGTFELTEEDDCVYEGDFESIDLSGDLIGALTISFNDSIYTITFEGDVVDDNIRTPFSMNYQDVVVNANAETGAGTLTIDSLSYTLNKGVCTDQSYQGLTLFAIVLTNADEDDIENSCVATLAFLGKKDIPVGTFPISEIPMAGPLFMVEANDMELIGMTGEATIVKNEDNSYSITANGTFRQENIRDEVTFSLNYEGSFLEMK